MAHPTGHPALIWQKVRLDEVSARGSGHTPNKKRADYWNGPISWVSLKDTSRLDSGLIIETAETITRKGLANSSAVLHPKGSIILLRDATIGKVAVLGGDMAVSQHFMAWRCGPQINNWYLYYYLQYMRPEFERVSNGSTIKTIGLDYFKNLAIPLPGIGEQRLISEAIQDADRVIHKLEVSIRKKEEFRLGVIQQLFTGHIRLPGFGDTWRVSNVGEILEFRNGLNKASQYFGSGTPIVNFMDVMRGPIITASNVAGRVTLTSDEIKRFSAKRGDIFFTRTSETVEEVGTAAALVDEIPDAAFSGFILRGRPRTNGSDSRFLAYLFQLNAVRKQVMAAASYTTRALTNGDSLSRVTIEVPSLNEQQAVAAVIIDSEAEIAALRIRLDKARDIKQGMMQQLLTDRIRLPA